MDDREVPQPSMGVVIVNWNGTHLLRECLTPLTRAGVPVIVVDNASSDGSVDLIQEMFPEVQVIKNPTNRGFAYANNQGMYALSTPYIMFLNNDTIPDPKALDDIAVFLGEHSLTGVAGPTLVFPDGRPQASCGPGPNLWTEFLSKSLLHRVFPTLRQWAPSASRQVDWVTGAALCIRRDLAIDLGGWDEAMFMFYEDLDLCARVREAGFSVWFLSTHPIVHIGGASRKKLETQSLVHSYESAQRFFDRHGSVWRRKVVAAMTVPEMALRSAVWALLSTSSRRRSLAKERLQAYALILRMAIRGRRLGRLDRHDG
ncbi:MAG TPA: glycosyltransferase family 2 protein [Actinomycetota bacterium]|nr:glycosyltransferase family 2 protein [Actinomycetota bacterium]